MAAKRRQHVFLALCGVSLIIAFGMKFSDKTFFATEPNQPQETLIHSPTEKLPQTQAPQLPHEPEVNPIPDDATLNSMSVGQLADFFHGYVLGPQVLCSRVVRMGKVSDGGWDVCDDPRYRPDPKNCLIYSFGIAYDFTFDDAMEKYGCEVHSFDPSMTKEKDHIRGQRVHFHKIGIGGGNINQTGKWALFTLGTIRNQNGHRPDKRRLDIVKMDVERGERGSIPKALDEGSLRDVSQLAFETHMGPNKGDPPKNVVVKYLAILRRLWDEGFRIYLTHRNLSSFNIYKSRSLGVEITTCHEIHMINTRQKKYINS